MYTIVYMLGYCDNCSEIVVDGISRDNNEIVCKRAGDNLTLEAKIPKVFDNANFVVRCNDQSCPINHKCNQSTLKCNLNNLTAENDGIYTVHVTVDTMITVNGSSYLEWCSNNVSVIVRSKAQSNMHNYIINYVRR